MLRIMSHLSILEVKEMGKYLTRRKRRHGRRTSQGGQSLKPQSPLQRPIKIHAFKCMYTPIPCLRIHRDIRAANLALPLLQRTCLHHAARNRSRKPIRTRGDREIRQRNLKRIASRDRRATPVLRLDLLLGDVQFGVAAVVPLLPLEFWIVADKVATYLFVGCNSTFEAIARGARDSELDADRALARGGVVWLLLEPDEIRHPVLMAVAGEHDGVANVVVIEVLQSAVLAAEIAIPCVGVDGHFTVGILTAEINA